MGRSYSHFTYTERALIYWWRKECLSLREMARRLRRHHASISRELRRNLWCGRLYYPRGAQIIYNWRLQDRVNRERLKAKGVRTYVDQKIALGWTPELIAGRLNREGQLPTVCHEAIYQYSYQTASHLIQYLPRQHQKRKPTRPYRKTGERIPNRTSLELRPMAATTRWACGHWEADMLVAADRTHGLNVLVDRTSRLTQISVLSNKTAAATKTVLLRRLQAYPSSLRQTITYDNGQENTQHEAINAALGTKSYFCASYHSWENGSVEQTNGLIRRFLPKGSNFRELGHAAINRIEKLLNNRPRKCLDYCTPYEVFREARGALQS
jgi:IS30 family transposase